MAEQETSSIDFAKYRGLILRRKYLALAVGLVVLSACTWGSVFWPKTYEASSTVVVKRSSVIDPLLKGVGVASNMEEQIRTLKDTLTSRSIMERVIKRLNLGDSDALVEGMRKRIDVTTRGGRSREPADLFVISYQGKEPRVVRDVVNTLVDEYIAESMGLRRADTHGAFEFIQAQLLEYKAKLEESDRSLRDFREKHPNMIPQSETAVLARMEGFESSRLDAEIKVKELQRRRENLKKQLSGESELTVGMVTREGTPQARLSFLNNQLVILTTKFTDKHPEVQKVKAEIEDLRQQISQAKGLPPDRSGAETATINPIYQQLKEDLVKTDAEIESLKARSAELLNQQRQAKGVLGGMPREQEEWTKLQRDRNVYQKIYDDLLLKLENARVSKDLEMTDKVPSFNVVDAAVLPLYPVKPDRVKLILLGIVLGIAAGIGAAIALESFDHSFKDEHSIEEKLGLPVLAAIPRVVSDTATAALSGRDRKIIVSTGAYLAVVLLVLVREVLVKFFGINLISL